MLHLLIAKCCKHPTIDLTWFCKNDLELNFIKIVSPIFFIFMELIFFIGDFAEHEAALKVEKSCVPSKNFAPFFKRLIFNFFLISQALFLSIDNNPCLLIIRYS